MWNFMTTDFIRKRPSLLLSFPPRAAAHRAKTLHSVVSFPLTSLFYLPLAPLYPSALYFTPPADSFQMPAPTFITKTRERERERSDKNELVADQETSAYINTCASRCPIPVPSSLSLSSSGASIFVPCREKTDLNFAEPQQAEPKFWECVTPLEVSDPSWQSP